MTTILHGLMRKYNLAAPCWCAIFSVSNEGVTALNLEQISAEFAARKPGHALGQYLYNSPDMLSFDMVAIYGQSWLFAGFEAEFKKAGDYTAFMVGAWPVVIVRGRDGELRAFHNSCRHRGSVICATGMGNEPRLTCPYHRWTYDLNGKLLAAGRMPEDFDKRDYGLNPIHLETVAGVVFICLAETPPSFEVMRAELAPLLAPHNLKHAKLAFQSTLVEYANWKLVMENARECYHCATGHPELSLSFPVNSTAHFDREGEGNRDFRERMTALGLPCGPAQEDWWQAMRFPLNAGHVAMTMDGQFNVKKLMNTENGGDIGSLRWALEPHHFAHSTSEFTFAFSAMPVGPTETHVYSKWMVHEDAVEGVDYTIESLTDLWTRTNLQDKALAENNQLGVNSPGYKPGPYSPDGEPLVIGFIDWYCAKSEAYLNSHRHD
jgi:Rieske 2Fe-2S family protein